MRKINKIIVHCTATPPSMLVNVKTIDTWHRQRGFAEIGYHFVVLRDGSIEKGRDLTKIGAHCLGNNKNSIGIAYVGGVKEDRRTPEDNRTDAQKEAILELIAKLRLEFGNIPVYGHRDFARVDCPCFDAKKEYN